MLKRIRNSGTRLIIIAFALMVGLLPFPGGGPSAHNPLALDETEAARHTLLTTVAADDFGHTHDDGSPEERQPGHLHGHNPADHSHETASPPPDAVSHDARGTQSWRSRYRFIDQPAPPFGLDRPPRPMPAA